MKITFLNAADGTPLIKTLTKKQTGITKEPYPHVLNFNSVEVNVEDIDDFAAAIEEYSEIGACLLKGNTGYRLQNQSRAKSTDANAPTRFLVLDIDGLPIGDHKVAQLPKKIEEVIHAMPKAFHNVSYLVQYSASAGIYSDKLSAHVFFMLDTEVPPTLIKLLMRQINLTTPLFLDNMTLSRTNTVLRYPLDITVNQNDKLIYIAPPKLVGIRSPFSKRTPRQHTLHKAVGYITVPDLLEDLKAAPAIDKLAKAQTDKLRVAKGMDKINSRTKMVRNIEVMANPGESVVSGVKTTDEFIYLNLNGGNSWAYYHPANNAEVIYNFKGEPNYATKNIAPEYYSQAVLGARKKKATEIAPKDPEAEDAVGKSYLAFRNISTDQYWNGSYDYDCNQLIISPTASKTRLVDFLKQHGQPVPDFIPDWNMEFRPHTLTRFDPENRFINTFVPSKYLLEALQPHAQSEIIKAPPKTITKVIHHALGSDDECFDRFINWLAVIVQKRTQTKTAWLLHGTQGTGKGVLFHNIITPILGNEHTQNKLLHDFEESFNGWMENCLCVLVDEVQLSESRQADKLMSKIKAYIPNPEVSIRHMRQTGVKRQSFMNMIFASNMPDPIKIDPEDRRFSCGLYQTEKISLNAQDIKQIHEELSSFAIYLMNYQANVELAGTPLINDAHLQLQILTRTSIDQISDALRDGDLEFFLSQMPEASKVNVLDVTASMKYQAYLDIFKTLIPEDAPDNLRVNVSREDLRTIIHYTMGGMPESPHKFTSLVKHHNIRIKPVRINDEIVRGVHVNWQVTDTTREIWKAHVPVKQKKAKSKKVTDIASRSRGAK